MKYSKRILGTFATLAVSGAFVASAHMGPELDANLSARFENEAKILGMTTEEVKNAWAEGKSIFDLAAEKGISTTTINAKMTEARDLEIKTKMNALVASGVLTEAQADKRIATMKKLGESKAAKKGSKHHDLMQSGDMHKQSMKAGLKKYFNL